MSHFSPHIYYFFIIFYYSWFIFDWANSSLQNGITTRPISSCSEAFDCITRLFVSNFLNILKTSWPYWLLGFWCESKDMDFCIFWDVLLNRFTICPEWAKRHFSFHLHFDCAHANKGNVSLTSEVKRRIGETGWQQKRDRHIDKTYTKWSTKAPRTKNDHKNRAILLHGVTNGSSSPAHSRKSSNNDLFPAQRAHHVSLSTVCVCVCGLLAERATGQIWLDPVTCCR